MNQNDYSFGQNDDGSSHEDQRAEFRLTGRATVTLELEAPDQELGDPGKSLVCHTHDLSANGIKVYTREALPNGALLPVVVALDGDSSEYALMSEVVWCNAKGEDGWAVGLRVMDSDDTSFLEWMDAVAKAMAED